MTSYRWLSCAVLVASAAAVVYDVHLKVGPNVYGAVTSFAARAKNLCPADDIYFNTSIPHVTLYQTDFVDGSMPVVVEAVKNLAPRMRACTVSLSDPILSGQYFMLGVPLTRCLRELSDAVVLATFMWHNASQPIPDWVIDSPDKDTLIPMFEKYGSPGVFEQFSPHVTVAWDEIDNMTVLLRVPYTRASDLSNWIGIGLVGPHGTVLQGEDQGVFELPKKDANFDYVVEVVGAVSGALSAAGSLIVIMSYVLFRDLRSKPRLLITILSVCDFGQAIFFCVPLDLKTSSALCDVQALWGIFFADTTFLWTAAISIYVFVSVSNVYSYLGRGNREGLKDPDRLIKYFHALCFGIPLLLIVLVAAFQVEGASSGPNWCFIPDTHSTWRICVLYVPLFVSILITTTLNVITIYHLQEIQRRYVTRKGAVDMTEWQTKLLLIPLIFIALRFSDVLYRIAELSGGYVYDSLHGSAAFVGVMTAGDALQGLVNFLIFVVGVRAVRMRLWYLIRHCRFPDPKSQYAVAAEQSSATDRTPLTSSHTLCQPLA